MIASLHKMIEARLFAILFGAMLVPSLPLDALQSEEDEHGQEAEPSQQSEDEAQISGSDADGAEGATAESPSEDRFFLGARPQLRRQVGPAVGKPRSILPHPFVPVGSISMAKAPDGQSPASDVDSGTVDDASVADAGQLLPDGTILDDIPAAGAAQPSTDDPSDFLTEAALETIDPSGISALDNGKAFPADFWGERSRANMVSILSVFANPTQFAPMQDIARRVALSPTALPAPENEADVARFIAARLQVLARHGDQSGYLALLDRLPRDYDWSGIARQRADGLLIAGRIEGACTLAAAERSDSADPYWLRLAAFCRAVEADRVGVDFQLGILEELTDIKPTFYQLIDQILLEAEQGGGEVLTSGQVLTTPLAVDVLEITMARLAKVQVPILQMENVNPLAAGSLLSVPGVADAARSQLMALGLEEGWLTAQTISAYLETAEAEERLPEDVLVRAALDDHLEVDMSLLMLAVSSETQEERDTILGILWQRAVRLGRTALIGPTIRTLLAGKGTDDVLVSKLVVRGNMLDGNEQSLIAAATDLRAGRMGDDAVKDDTLLAVWPLLSAAMGSGGPAVSDTALFAWWQSRPEAEGKAAEAALLFTTLEALGHAVPDALWQEVEAGIQPVSMGQTVSPALWRRMLVAAAAGDRGGVLALAYRMTAAGRVSDAFTSSLVATLAEAGLESEARQVAVHMLVGRGL